MVIWLNSKKQFSTMLKNNLDTFYKQVVMRQLAWSCVTDRDKSYGVILPDFESVKKFKNELMQVLGEVPNWMLQLECANMRRIKTINNVSILLFNTIDGMRGITLHGIYVADDISRKQVDQFLTCMVPALVGRSIVSFHNS